MPVPLPEHEVGTAWAQREGILMARCRAKNAEGKPCRAPEGMVDSITRYCPAHRPGATARLREAGRKGAKVSTRLRHKAAGLSSDDLPPLRSPQDAEAWLERIGRAVATGELVNRDADAATRAVREWLRAHEAGTVTEQVDELRRKVAALGSEKLKALP